MSIVIRDTLAPAKTTATVGTVSTVIVAAIDLLRFDKKVFTVKNTGAVALDTGAVQSTPVGLDAVAGDWEDYDTVTLIGLAPGQVRSVAVSDDSHRFWRVVGTVLVGETTTDGYVTAGSM